MRRLLATMLFAITAIAHAEDSQWVQLASTDEARWDGMAGTRDAGRTKGGKDITVATGRVYDVKRKTYTFEKWYVTIEHCKQGYGKVVTLDTEGTYKFETDFALSGGSVASTLAGMLCRPVKDTESKGI